VPVTYVRVQAGRADDEEDQERRTHERPGLERDVKHWIVSWNENPRPCIWVETAEEILASVARYCGRLSAVMAAK
jgi:hypothetical protein